jgi:hypothetical protein
MYSTVRNYDTLRFPFSIPRNKQYIVSQFYCYISYERYNCTRTVLFVYEKQYSTTIIIT